MQWSPGEDFLRAASQVLARAQEQAVRQREARVSAGDHELASRGIRGGPNIQLREDAAADCVRSYGRQGLTELLGLIRSVYGRVPGEAAQWVKGYLQPRIESFANSHGVSLEDARRKAGITTDGARRDVTRAATEALRDLEIGMAPYRIRLAEGIPDPEERVTGHRSTVYNVTGPNARVNVESVDSSTNVVNTSVTQLFESMRVAVDGLSDASVKSTLKSSIEQMEATQGTGSFAQKYADFMQLAANHVAVFQPFFPALAQLLGGGG